MNKQQMEAASVACSERLLGVAQRVLPQLLESQLLVIKAALEVAWAEGYGAGLNASGEIVNNTIDAALAKLKGIAA